MNFLFHSKFLILLLTLLLLLAVQPMSGGYLDSLLWFDVLFSLVLLAAVISLCEQQRVRVTVLLLGIPPFVITWSGYVLPDAASEGAMMLGHFFGALLFFFAAVMTITAILRRTEVSLDVVFGAVCGYLLLGIAWGISFALLDIVQPDAFLAEGRMAEHLGTAGLHMHTFIYYSFVTLTTLGYGDITPISPVAKTLSWMEAIAGQFYLAVIVAGIVGVIVSRSVRRNIDMAAESSGERSHRE